MNRLPPIGPGQILTGPLFSEPIRVETMLANGPANLAFQWQRELEEKFDTKFLVMKGQDLREQMGVPR